MTFLALLLVMGTSGCVGDQGQGYTAATIFPDGISTITVPIFANDTYHRDVEFELTDAVIKVIESHTPYKVTSGSRADSILLGRIRSIELEQLSKSRFTGLSEEVILSMSIDFEWNDLRTGRAIVQRKSFSGHGLFVPSRPTGEPIELGTFAAVQQLARDIVSEMQAEW